MKIIRSKTLLPAMFLVTLSCYAIIDWKQCPSAADCGCEASNESHSVCATALGCNTNACTVVTSADFLWCKASSNANKCLENSSRYPFNTIVNYYFGQCGGGLFPTQCGCLAQGPYYYPEVVDGIIFREYGTVQCGGG